MNSHSYEDSPTAYVNKGVILMNGAMRYHSPPIPKEEPGDLENFLVYHNNNTTNNNNKNDVT